MNYTGLFKGWIKKNQNWMIALFFVIGVGIFVGYRFDYCYGTNDDRLMKDILAGVYTGMPESRNIFMQWLLSAFISLFYRGAGDLPWYGLFLCACHFGCFFLILKRSLIFAENLSGKLIIAFTEALLFTGLFLNHLVYAMFTVTSALLGSTAAFLFYTTDITLPAKVFIRKNIPAVLLVSVAFLIRWNMLCLVFPMICVAGIAKWGCEQKIFTKENVTKYFTVIGLIFAGILIGQLTHMLAYGSEEWRAYIKFNDNRSELYDFQGIPSYEENREFYDSIGLSEKEEILLDNYNLGLSEKIDETMIEQIAEYSIAQNSSENSSAGKFWEKLKYYIHRLTNNFDDTDSDYSWHYAVILGYFALLLLGILGKWRGVIWKLLLLFVVRTLLWMYILMGGRMPERITHSLYLCELCILAAMILVEWKQVSCKKIGKFLGGFVTLGFAVLALIILPPSIKQVETKQIDKEATNASFKELYAYFSSDENADNFYLINVSTWVGYSEKMFEDVDNSLDNYDIMGGWICKSPLQKKKLEGFGISNMECGLKDKENVYFVCNSGGDVHWLEDYYEEHGTPVEIVSVITICDQFEVYAVTEKRPQLIINEEEL
ncbi:MAG: hypothetical protein Q4D94_11575 [Bacillota bacterium]|nr:hypothetical protein [Bacillota bacterium]